MSESKRYALIIGAAVSDPEHYGSTMFFPTAQKSSEYLKHFFLHEDGVKFDEADVQLLTYKNATFEAVKSSISRHSEIMVDGDLLVISFCGHTYKVEPDDKLINAQNTDRGWGLYDRICFYFELWQMFQQFRKGTKIIIIADSCYSGILESKLSKENLQSLLSRNISSKKLMEITLGKILENGSEIAQNLGKNLMSNEYATNVGLYSWHDFKNLDNEENIFSLIASNHVDLGLANQLATMALKFDRVQASNERQWFTREDNIEFYRPILLNSGKPALHAIPPAVVIIGASSLNDSIPSGIYREGRTIFSESFQDAWPMDRGDHNSLTSFYDDLSWLVQWKMLKQNCTGSQSIKPTDLEMKNRIVPQWHYHQGHKYTNIRSEVPFSKV